MKKRIILFASKDTNTALTDNNITKKDFKKDLNDGNDRCPFFENMLPIGW